MPRETEVCQIIQITQPLPQHHRHLLHTPPVNHLREGTNVRTKPIKPPRGTHRAGGTGRAFHFPQVSSKVHSPSGVHLPRKKIVKQTPIAMGGSAGPRQVLCRRRGCGPPWDHSCAFIHSAACVGGGIKARFPGSGLPARRASRSACRCAIGRHRKGDDVAAMAVRTSWLSWLVKRRVTWLSRNAPSTASLPCQLRRVAVGEKS